MITDHPTTSPIPLTETNIALHDQSNPQAPKLISFEFEASHASQRTPNPSLHLGNELGFPTESPTAVVEQSMLKYRDDPAKSDEPLLPPVSASATIPNVENAPAQRKDETDTHAQQNETSTSGKIRTPVTLYEEAKARGEERASVAAQEKEAKRLEKNAKARQKRAEKKSVATSTPFKHGTPKTQKVTKPRAPRKAKVASNPATPKPKAAKAKGPECSGSSGSKAPSTKNDEPTKPATSHAEAWSAMIDHAKEGRTTRSQGSANTRFQVQK